MNKISNQELNIDILKRIESINNEANSLNSLDSKFLNISPSEGKWSVKQCFEHLSLTLKYYLTAIDKGLNKSKNSNINPSIYYQPGFIGNWFYHKMMPITSTSKSSKIKTFRKLLPAPKEESISKFIEVHNQFIQFINEIPNQNLEKTRVVSLAGPIVKFKLGDAYRIITAHNE